MPSVECLTRDLFPCEVYDSASGKIHKVARVFVTTERILVSVEENGRVSTPIERTLIEPVDANRRQLNHHDRAKFRTLAGEIHVTRAGHCGCGSPLKALGPPVGW